MPRQGEGHVAHNAVEAGKDVAIGSEGSSEVDRSSKAAALPEGEKGKAIEGMNASGGGSQGLGEDGNVGQGKGESS